jgi:hypothetical protein
MRRAVDLALPRVDGPQFFSPLGKALLAEMDRTGKVDGA